MTFLVSVRILMLDFVPNLLDFTLFISPPKDLNFIGMRDDYPTKVCHEIFLGQKTPRIINMIDSPEFSKNGKKQY